MAKYINYVVLECGGWSRIPSLYTGNCAHNYKYAMGVCNFRDSVRLFVPSEFREVCILCFCFRKFSFEF